ncbi:MAG: K(+)-transporting ATPase subunit C [Nostocales cyanobacterium]|nr:MAG: K(+)-transporting ATPase subunit C [Nostocales cyanobacterium]TAF12695.1 MAG: K(+)-transporting ATPase subunit C [Nostocales cyanobacterium]
MIFLQETFRALRICLLIWLLTAIIYPLALTFFAQSAFSYSANGSLVLNINAQPIGSSLIGQIFTTDKYFHSRPSSVKYSQGKRAIPLGISGGSNLAPSNSDLTTRIIDLATEFSEENIQPAADLIYASGSGLDPHISLKAARQQLTKVAQARGIKENEIIPLINKYTDDRFLGIFGEPGVNVLRLNYALDLQEINLKQN